MIQVCCTFAMVIINQDNVRRSAESSALLFCRGNRISNCDSDPLRRRGFSVTIGGATNFADGLPGDLTLRQHALGMRCEFLDHSILLQSP